MILIFHRYHTLFACFIGGQRVQTEIPPLSVLSLQVCYKQDESQQKHSFDQLIAELEAHPDGMLSTYVQQLDHSFLSLFVSRKCILIEPSLY